MICGDFRTTARLASAMALQDEAIRELREHRGVCPECADWLEKSDQHLRLRQRIDRVDKPQPSFIRRLFGRQ